MEGFVIGAIIVIGVGAVITIIIDSWDYWRK